MKQETIIKWLDALIKISKKWVDVCKGPNKSLKACDGYTDGIHLFGCIDKIANVMGWKLEEKPHDEKYDCKYFYYKGIEFFELSRKEEIVNG